MKDSILPIVFASGLLVGGVLSLLLRGLLMQIVEWPHYVPPPVDATPPLEPDEPVEFSTKMSNEEWIDAVLRDILSDRSADT